jgi:hypothetical protein
MENQIDFHAARWLLRDQYILEGSQHIIEKQHKQAVITLPELSYFLEQQGFTDMRTYASYCSRIAETATAGEKILLAAQKPVNDL